jgi:hypothetical protein
VISTGAVLWLFYVVVGPPFGQRAVAAVTMPTEALCQQTVDAFNRRDVLALLDRSDVDVRATGCWAKDPYP